jgi:hypothetical protein
MVEYYKQTNPDAIDWMDKYGPAVMAAEPAAMARFIGAVRGHYGSLTECAGAIGGPDIVDNLRAALLT